MSTVLQDQVMANGRNHSWKTIVLALLLIGVAALAVWQFALPALRGSGGTAGDNLAPQALWESQGVDSYQYDLQVSCFCIFELVRPVRVVVENGEVSSITYLDDNTTADPALFEGYATVEQLFARLTAVQAENPVKFDVTYDETFGVPLSANIDISETMADEEVRFTVTNFETR
ncbi:MAG: hypothetical protein IPM53_28990 [Anaerolineaceae bacterium]|nr:hypothetical protein [Anaerolineaceae bacterium]